jgi:hypothetical protein
MLSSTLKETTTIREMNAQPDTQSLLEDTYKNGSIFKTICRYIWDDPLETIIAPGCFPLLRNRLSGSPYADW